MKVAYVAGPYRAKHEYQIEENIRCAERAKIELARMGHAVYCPHMNSARLGGLMPDQHWLDEGLRFLEMCDFVFVVGDWNASEGTKNEIVCAVMMGIPVYHSLNDVAMYEGFCGKDME
jgi:hypothetical protein